MDTGYFIRDGRVCGPHGDMECFLRDGYLSPTHWYHYNHDHFFFVRGGEIWMAQPAPLREGESDEDRFLGRLPEPEPVNAAWTGFVIRDGRIYGPSTTLPWDPYGEGYRILRETNREPFSYTEPPFDTWYATGGTYTYWLEEESFAEQLANWPSDVPTPLETSCLPRCVLKRVQEIEAAERSAGRRSSPSITLTIDTARAYTECFEAGEIDAHGRPILPAG